MNFKKILSLVLAISFILLSGCGSGGSAGQAGSAAAASAPQQAAPSAPAAPAAQPAAPANNFKPVELSLATSYGTTHAIYAYLEKYAEMVKNATDGNVSITIYASNTLVAANDAHSGVVHGVVDMVETDISYDVAAFPLASSTYLPNLGAKSSKTYTYAFNEFYKSDLKEFEGMKMMWAFGMTPFAVLSNKPITTIEDMKGLQIRASGFALDAMAAIGATPVGMPISEAYEAAQKGTVQAICNSYETLKGWNFAEVVKYGTVVPIIATGNHYVAMNLDTWNSIPAEYQATIEKVNNEIVDEIAPTFDRIDQEGYDYGKELGIQYSEITGDELQRWSDALQPIVDKWLAEKSAMGLDAQGTYDYLKSLIEKYKAIYE